MNNLRGQTDVPSLRERLRTDLRIALKARNASTVNTLRSLLATIDNAEAVDIAAAPRAVNGVAPDVARRILSETDIQAIIAAEAHTYRATLATYETHGQHTAAAQIREDLTIIEAYLIDVPSGE